MKGTLALEMTKSIWTKYYLEVLRYLGIKFVIAQRVLNDYINFGGI